VISVYSCIPGIDEFNALKLLRLVFKNIEILKILKKYFLRLEL